MLPPEQMRRLFDILTSAGGKRVVWTEFPEGTHMEAYEVCRAEYWPALRAFFEQHVLTGAIPELFSLDLELSVIRSSDLQQHRLRAGPRFLGPLASRPLRFLQNSV